MKTTIQEVFFDLTDLLENNPHLENLVIEGAAEFSTLGEFIAEQREKLEALEAMAEREEAERAPAPDGSTIAIVWCIEDVQSVREDLDDEQAAHVLATCEARHDADVGINWEFIGAVADSLYP